MPFDDGNSCWKMRLFGRDGHSRGLLVLARLGYDRNGEEEWEPFGNRTWPGRPREQQFETLYQWDWSTENFLYFVLIHFGHEFTEDDYCRELTHQQAADWLRAEGYELPEDLVEFASNTDALNARTTGTVSPPLAPAQDEVWNFLANKALGAKEIARKVPGGFTSEDAIRKRIASIRNSGRMISYKPGLGYYRPDAPPN